MLTAAQGGTCAIVKVECCVYIPDLSGNVSTAFDVMKNQVKAMSNENIPFWTLVLSWVKGDWWKTIFIIVTVVLIVLLCGPCILQCSMNFVTQRLLSFSQTGSWRARCNISLWMMLILWVKSIKRGEWRRKQTEQAPSWKQDSILGQTVDFELYAQYLWKRHTNWKTRPPGWKSPRART